MDLHTFSLAGAMLVVLCFHTSVLYAIFAFGFHIDDDILRRLALAVFVGLVPGIFVAAVYPPAQPFVAAIITTIVLFRMFPLSPARRTLVAGINLFWAFVPPLIRSFMGG